MVKYANLPPQWVLLQRINLGLYAILARLGATRDWFAICQETVALRGYDGPPSTELGRQEAAWWSATTACSAETERTESVSRPEVTISSPDKVMFADRGETKADLAAYYEAVEAPSDGHDGRTAAVAAALPERRRAARRSSRSGCPRSIPSGSRRRW